MEIASKVITGFVALMHVYILWMEMFAWTSRGRKAFGGTREFFESTKDMAANQGLYNGFLAAGLIWSFFITDGQWQLNVALFFLACVAIAGIYGGYSVNKRIFFLQGLPAILGIILLLLK